MAKISASQAAQKWNRNLAGSTQAIKDGVNAVTVSPTEKAARQADAYAQGVARAVADGSYQAGLRKVTLDDWKTAMTSKGIPRIASGAQAAVGKMEDFLTEFLPHVEAGQRMLESMPRGDIQQNIQRAVAMIEHNAKFKRRS
jgi:hypothetical protein